MAQNGSNVKSVMKAMQLLDHLAAAKQPLSLQELSLRTGFAKSTVYGLLSSMREYHVIDQSPLDGRYRLGVRLFELGSAVASSWDVLTIAKNYMQNIALQTGESVHIAMLDRDEVLYLSHADIANPLRIVAEDGARFPAHCTSFGKAVLAYMSDYEAVNVLNRAGMQTYTPHTITGIEQMKRELEQVRENGYAVEDGEFRIGLRSVAAPIFDIERRVGYAIGVVGMFRKTNTEAFLQATELVKDAAAAISEEMGYRG